MTSMLSGIFATLVRRPLLALSVLGLGALACSESDPTYGGPLALTVTSNAPVSAADSLVVEYEVDGASLLGLEIDWGDMMVDSVFFSGAQFAAGRVAHLYGASGDFSITATVDDADQGSVSEELDVTIDP